MRFGSCRLNMLLAFLCAFSLFVNTAHTESVDENLDQLQKNDSITRRQDNGFNFMNYFMGNRQQAQQNQQQANNDQQQLRQAQGQQPHNIQQQHNLQQQQLAQHQLQQQQQLQELQKQQLLQLQQQQQAPRSNEVYHDSTAQQQQQVVALNREGGYGGIGIGGGAYAPPQKEVGISIGGKKPNVIQVGNILTLLPRILNVLSAGGKVMFGVELGNNFYFGPVGAKPLHG